MVSLRVVAAAGAATALLAPAAAQAKTGQVFVGPPPATQKKMGQTTTANAFFPTKLKVNVNDSVRFVPVGFHTVDFPKKGNGALALIVPTGQKVAGVNDAAGAPFWFNGQDALSLNPAFAQSGWGKTFSYNGSKQVESGLPGNKAKPLTVKFTKTGTFTYYCDLHPGMKGTITVAKKGASVPSSGQDARTVAKQASAALKASKGLDKTNPGPNTVSVGVAAKGGVEDLAMIPANLNVTRGTTVKFEMSKGSFETHTATFGPGDINDPSSYIGGIAASFDSPQLDPRGVYPSDITPVSISPTLHGNGFWNSGAMDANSKSALPGSASVRFDTPGTYKFYCLIHPFMQGTISVQ